MVERVRGGGRSRFTVQIPDTGGDQRFELTLAGPEALVEQTFGEGEIELEIDSTKGEEGWQREFDEARAQERRSMWEVAALDNLDDLLKPRPPHPDPETAVLAAIRPLEGEGTPFFARFTSFFVAGAVNVLFAGSWVSSTFATVTPASGDQDLFLHLYSPATWPVAASVRGAPSPTSSPLPGPPLGSSSRGSASSAGRPGSARTSPPRDARRGKPPARRADAPRVGDGPAQS
jgi:hypothetical protein